MKANEAPEKIWMNDDWVHQFDVKEFMGEESVEYTRTDYFVEKACEWLRNDTYGYLIEKWGETDIDRENLVEDFKKAMKL